MVSSASNDQKLETKRAQIFLEPILLNELFYPIESETAPKIDQGLWIRFLNEDDIFSLFSLQNEIYESLKSDEKHFMLKSDGNNLKNLLKMPEIRFLGFFQSNGALRGYSAIHFQPNYDDIGLGSDVITNSGFAKEEEAALLFRTAFHKDLKGQGLQTIATFIRAALAVEKGRRFLISEVATNNGKSCNELLNAGIKANRWSKNSKDSAPVVAFSSKTYDVIKFLQEPTVKKELGVTNQFFDLFSGFKRVALPEFSTS